MELGTWNSELGAALDSIAAIDNHCHPIVRDQDVDPVRWRRYFSEAHDPAVAAHDVPHTLYYRWAMRQIGAWLGVESNEDEILAARRRLGLGDYVRRLADDAKLGGLVIDEGYPPGGESYSASETAALFGVRSVRLLRLETLLQRLIVATGSFDAVEDAFLEVVGDARRAGYAGLKSIAAYRVGLAVQTVDRGQARESFAPVQREARAMGSIRLADKTVIDYFLNLTLEHAARQELPVQFHTGYGDPDLDLAQANPLLLREVVERFPDVPIVLLHESYPYTREASFLAAVYPNVYVDVSSVIPFLGRSEIVSSFGIALAVAPATRILYSSDGVNLPEFHWLGPGRARSILRELLERSVVAGELGLDDAVDIARRVLAGNAARLYAIPI